jgi:hypothetical protein
MRQSAMLGKAIAFVPPFHRRGQGPKREQRNVWLGSPKISGRTIRRAKSPGPGQAPWQFLNFLPELQEHGSLRPCLIPFRGGGDGALGTRGIAPRPGNDPC